MSRLWNTKFIIENENQSTRAWGVFRGALMPVSPLKVENIYYVERGKKFYRLGLLIFEHFWKCSLHLKYTLLLQFYIYPLIKIICRGPIIGGGANSICIEVEFSEAPPMRRPIVLPGQVKYLRATVTDVLRWEMEACCRSGCRDGDIETPDHNAKSEWYCRREDIILNLDKKTNWLGLEECQLTQG